MHLGVTILKSPTLYLFCSNSLGRGERKWNTATLNASNDKNVFQAPGDQPGPTTQPTVQEEIVSTAYTSIEGTTYKIGRDKT